MPSNHYSWSNQPGSPVLPWVSCWTAPIAPHLTILLQQDQTTIKACMVISKEHVTPTHYNHTLIHTRHLHESHQPPMSLDGIQNPTESTLYHWSSPSFQALPFTPTCDDIIQNITTIWIKVTTFLNYINYYIQQLEIYQPAQRACIMNDDRTQTMVQPPPLTLITTEATIWHSEPASWMKQNPGHGATSATYLH